jgi:hypothetical protein
VCVCVHGDQWQFVIFNIDRERKVLGSHPFVREEERENERELDDDDEIDVDED